MARQESEHHAERRIDANAQRRTKGLFNTEGFRPFGYIRSGSCDTREGKPVEPEASAMRQAVKDVLNGTSLVSIARDWNARDIDWCALCVTSHKRCAKPTEHRRGLSTSRGKPWSNLTLRRMLMNPTYAGLVTHKGKIVGGDTPLIGAWEPLIDKDTHYSLVAFLTDDARRPAISFERKHVGSGVYRCGKCGAPLYAGRPYGAKRPVTYICRNKAHLGRLAAPLDAYIEQLVLGLLRREDIGSRLCKDTDVDIDGLTAQRAGLIAQKTQLAELLVEGVLTVEGVRTQSKKLDARIAGITTVLADAARTSPATRLLADGPDKIEEHWDNATPDIKGKIINELMTVTVLGVPKGHRGVLPDDEGQWVINDTYIDIKPLV